MTPSGEPDGEVVPGHHETTIVADGGTEVADAPPAVPPRPGEDSGAGGDDDGPSRRDRIQRLTIEWVVLIGAALLIAFLIKTFLFQAFYIPSASMEPTLNIGDRVLVNKLSYDFHDLHRGDIVVFSAPPGERTGNIQDLVKRVIGLPGETVTERTDGVVYINGRRLQEPYLPKGATTRPEGQAVPPGCGPPADQSPGCVVPPGRVFVLGDNRTQSKDGRTFGTINESSIVGRVFVRIWPLDNLSFL